MHLHSLSCSKAVAVKGQKCRAGGLKPTQTASEPILSPAEKDLGRNCKKTSLTPTKENFKGQKARMLKVIEVKAHVTRSGKAHLHKGCGVSTCPQ